MNIAKETDLHSSYVHKNTEIVESQNREQPKRAVFRSVKSALSLVLIRAIIDDAGSVNHVEYSAFK